MDDWLRWWAAPAWPRARLIALPPAGGSAHLFQPFSRYLPADVELVAAELPGHGSRLLEPPATTMADIVEPLAARVRALAPLPTALLGHSMGAIVALALCHRLRSDEPGWAPEALFAVASEAPGSRRTAEDLATTTDALLVRFLAGAHAGTQSGAIDPALQELVLPALRADLTLLERYRPAPEPPLACPVRVLTGAEDPFVTADDRDGWFGVSDDVEAYQFPGGHFFYRDPAAAAKAADRIAAELHRTTSPTGRRSL
jgi:surfactin synthase thioesterase subunit